VEPWKIDSMSIVQYNVIIPSMLYKIFSDFEVGRSVHHHTIQIN